MGQFCHKTLNICEYVQLEKLAYARADYKIPITHRMHTLATIHVKTKA